MPNISIAQANVALPPSQISVGGVRSVTFATTWDVYFPTGMTFFLSDHVLLKNILSIPEFRLTQFWGTFKGFGQMGPVSDDLKRTFYYPKRNKPLNTDNPNIGMQQRVKYMDNP